MPDQKLFFELTEEVKEKIRQVLMQQWDPIGIANEPMAQDEYDSYIPVICRMLVTNQGKQAIADHLHQIETDYMELHGDYNQCMKTAEALLALNLPS